MDKKHFVYILKTERNTLYCGYTDDVEKGFSNIWKVKELNTQKPTNLHKLFIQKNLKQKAKL